MLAFKRKAESLGARFLEGTRVRGLKRDTGVWHVDTDKGVEQAPVVVNCAGAWAGTIAAMLGEPVPLEVIAPMREALGQYRRQFEHARGTEEAPEQH